MTRSDPRVAIGAGPLRAAIALLALALVLWFGVLTRNDAVGQSAAARIHHHPDMDPADWARALDDLRSAELLDPGTDWEISRASYLLLRDRDASARVAESVIDREPDNLQAWVVLWRATRGRDPARAREAAAQIRRLNPPPDGR